LERRYYRPSYKHPHEKYSYEEPQLELRTSSLTIFEAVNAFDGALETLIRKLPHHKRNLDRFVVFIDYHLELYKELNERSAQLQKHGIHADIDELSKATADIDKWCSEMHTFMPILERWERSYLEFELEASKLGLRQWSLRKEEARKKLVSMGIKVAKDKEAETELRAILEEK
jgi:hypothetical protein